MSEQNMETVEQIGIALFKATVPERAIILAYAQGIAQGKELAKKQMEADKAEAEKKEAGEDG